MKHYQTIIIGGGISGLACAKRLYEKDRDFLVITKELGGRMKWDEKTGINMGAGIIMSDNKNILKYIKIKERKTHQSVKNALLCDEKCRPISTIALENVRNIPKMLKLLFFIWRMDRHAKKLMSKLPHESLRDVLEKDTFLKWAFLTPATEFVKKHGLEEISRKYVNPIINSTFYTSYENVNTFYYLGNLAPMFSKIYLPDFTGVVEKLTKGFEEKILLDEVKGVNKKDGVFEVATSESTFIADNVVFAAPEQSLRGVYDLPRAQIQQDVHRFVVKGKRKEEYSSHKVVFNPDNHHILSISNERGYDIVSASKEDPGFDKYYDSYEILNHIHWTPATIIPKEITNQNPEEGVYIASDYNFSAVEYSFVSGLYAANQIIKKS